MQDEVYLLYSSNVPNKVKGLRCGERNPRICCEGSLSWKKPPSGVAYPTLFNVHLTSVSGHLTCFIF